MWWISNTGQIEQAAANPGGWLGPYPTKAAAQAVLGQGTSGGGGGSGDTWWLNNSTGKVQQSATSPGPGWTGYPDENAVIAAATKWATDHINNQLVPGVSSTPGSGPLASVDAFLTHVADGAMWRSLGWVALGVLLILSGLYLWLKKAGVVPDAVPIPVPV